MQDLAGSKREAMNILEAIAKAIAYELMDAMARTIAYG